MPHRNHIPEKIRNALSKLHQLINKGRFIRGNLVYLRNKCGKKNCKCYKGERHVSLYIRQSFKGKPKMILIPKAKWEELKEMNDRYKEILRLLEEVSIYEWEHIKNKK
jgi:hypothetical protein